MRTPPTMSPPTDADMLPLDYTCATCGVVGPAAIVAIPGDGGSPYTLCADCARDREHLRTLIRAVGVRAVVVQAAPHAGHAA